MSSINKRRVGLFVLGVSALVAVAFLVPALHVAPAHAQVAATTGCSAGCQNGDECIGNSCIYTAGLSSGNGTVASNGTSCGNVSAPEAGDICENGQWLYVGGTVASATTPVATGSSCSTATCSAVGYGCVANQCVFTGAGTACSTNSQCPTGDSCFEPGTQYSYCSPPSTTNPNLGYLGQGGSNNVSVENALSGLPSSDLQGCSVTYATTIAEAQSCDAIFTAQAGALGYGSSCIDTWNSTAGATGQNTGFYFSTCTLSGSGILGNLNGVQETPYVVVGEGVNGTNNWSIVNPGAAPTTPSIPKTPPIITVVASTTPTTPATSNDIITGVQGYDQTNGAYTDGTAVVNTYLVVYGGAGNFGGSENTVMINGASVTQDITFQNAKQINISLAGLPVSNQNTVTVTTPTGVSGSANFTIEVSSTGATSTGNSNSCSQAERAEAALSAEIAQSPLNDIIDSSLPSINAAVQAATSACSPTPPTTQPTQPTQPTSPAVACSGSVITTGFPLTILVTASTLYVRAGPSTSASLAGSETLSAGDTFTAANEVQGDCVEGSNLWWVSSKGNYVWAGETTVEGSSAVNQPSTTGSIITAPVEVAGVSNGSITKNVTSGGTQYAVTYSYLPDGEVSATFTYKGNEYAVQNYNTLGVNGIARVQSGGAFSIPWTGQIDLTLLQLANQISINSPSNEVIFPGFGFATPLWNVTNVSPNYISSPVNAFEITSSLASNVPTPGLYDLDQDANGNLIGVTPVNISNSGAVTTGTEIVIQQNETASSSSQTVLGTDPTDYLSELTSGLHSEGYLIFQNTDALGETAGLAQKARATALYFSLGDQVVSGIPSSGSPACIVNTSNGTPVPVLVSPDGTIPHLNQNFNISIDPSAYALWSTKTPQEVQSDIIGIFNQGYSAYSQIGGLPQPVEDQGAGAIVIISFGYIPPQDNWTFQNGQYANAPASIAAQAVTLIPNSAGSFSNYVPAGSSPAIIDALNAGKEVIIITVNSQEFGPSSGVLSPSSSAATELASVLEHEMGHPLGLADDYANGQSPMKGGDTGPFSPIAVSQGIASVLSGIQGKTGFTAAQCAPNSGDNAGTAPSQVIQGFIPITSLNESSSVWGYAGSCTEDQLGEGWINAPACTGDTPAAWCNGASEGCYLPVATSTSDISFGNGNFPDQTPNATCLDNYGIAYYCASTDCNGPGQLACPVNIPASTCLDSNGDVMTCPGAFLPVPPPPAVIEGGYDCSSDGSCEYNPNDGTYSNSSCDDACDQ